MKNLLLIFLALPLIVNAQKSTDHTIGEFNRLIVSPHIDVVLVEGNQPHVRIEYENIDVHEIHVDRSGKTLKLYLEHAKIFEKTERTNQHYSRGVYHDARVTAYVTFTELEMLEIRGDQHIEVKSPIRAEQFKLKIYGENIVDLAGVNAEYFKVSMFGENELTIGDGEVEYQKYTLYGDNAIDAGGISSQHSHTNIYGESEIMLHADHELRITAVGEGIISYSGTPVLNKGIIIGEPRIYARN